MQEEDPMELPEEVFAYSVVVEVPEIISSKPSSTKKGAVSAKKLPTGGASENVICPIKVEVPEPAAVAIEAVKKPAKGKKVVKKSPVKV